MVDQSISKHDLFSANDGLVTYDAQTDLQWLNLSATRDRSYDAVLNALNSDQRFQGWRFAGRAEVDVFYRKFGFGSGIQTAVLPNSQFAQSWADFISYLGNIVFVQGTQTKFYVLFDNLSPTDRQAHYIKNILDSDVVNGKDLIFIEQAEYLRDDHFSNMASFLVRSGKPADLSLSPPTAPGSLSVS